MLINTGSPRSVVAHTVSGALVGLLSAGFMEDVSKAADKTTLKSRKHRKYSLFFSAVKTGIIAASAVSASNALGDGSKSAGGSLLTATSSVVMGVLGLYATDVIQNKIQASLDSKDTVKSKKEKI